MLRPLLGILGLLGVLSAATTQLSEQMLSALAASKLSKARNIIIYPPWMRPRLHSHIRQLPVPVRLVSGSVHELLREFGFSQFVKGERLQQFVQGERLLFVPWYWNLTAVVRAHLVHITTYSNQLHFIISGASHEETLREFSVGLCQVTSVSTKGFNVPAGRYKECGTRRTVAASQLFAVDKSKTEFPTGQNFVAIAGAINEDVASHPEALALFDVYKTKNNTVNVFKENTHVGLALKDADFSLLPLPLVVNLAAHFFMYAQYSPGEMCLFSRSVTIVRLSFADSWTSFAWLLVTLTSLGAIIAVGVWLRSRLVLAHLRFSKSNFLLFLVCTFLGRCPSSSVGNTAGYRGLALASWMLGMLFLGNYVQTSLIAIQSVPTTSGGITSMGNLKVHVEEGYRSPQMDFIIDAFHHCGKECFPAGSVSKCYEKARSGKHVALSLCSPEEVLAAARWGVLPGEHCGLVHQASLMLNLNPLRYQHRRLLLIVAEIGLAARHRKHSSPPSEEPEQGPQAFLLFFAIYAGGCALALVALCCELLWYAWNCRVQRRTLPAAFLTSQLFLYALFSR